MKPSLVSHNNNINTWNTERLCPPQCQIVKLKILMKHQCTHLDGLHITYYTAIMTIPLLSLCQMYLIGFGDVELKPHEKNTFPWQLLTFLYLSRE